MLLRWLVISLLSLTIFLCIGMHGILCRITKRPGNIFTERTVAMILEPVLQERTVYPLARRARRACLIGYCQPTEFTVGDFARTEIYFLVRYKNFQNCMFRIYHDQYENLMKLRVSPKCARPSALWYRGFRSPTMSMVLRILETI